MATKTRSGLASRHPPGNGLTVQNAIATILYQPLPLHSLAPWLSPARYGLTVQNASFVNFDREGMVAVGGFAKARPTIPNPNPNPNPNP